MPSLRPGPACVGLALLAAIAGCRKGAGSELGVSPVRWEAPLLVDSGGGHRGPWRMNESEYDYVDDPTLAISARGDVSVAWVDQARKDVLFQAFGREGRARFAEPLDVSRSPTTFSWLPRMVLTGPGEQGVALLWQEIIFSGGSHGGEILFARSADGGRSFSPPLNLSNSQAGDGKGRLDREVWDNGSLDLAAGRAGALYAAWTEYQGALWVARSADDGQTFSTPVRVSGTEERPARGPTLAVSPDGMVLVAWTVGEDAAADIHWTSSGDGGVTFAAPRVAWRSAGHSDAPKLAVDRAGTLHLVFAEGERDRHRIYYASSTLAPLRFEPRPLSERAELARGRYPALALDAAGGVFVLWELYPHAAGRPRGLGFALSRDGGRTFTEPSLVPGSAGPGDTLNGGQQGLLGRKLAVSAGGALAAVHSTFTPERASEIWLFRSDVGP